jgi:hypothetical protein
MITELEALYKRLDEMRMTPADRELAKARLAQAEAFVAAFEGALARLARLIGAYNARAPRTLGLAAREQNSQA